MSIGIIGTYNFGETPVYGKHPDPYSLGINWLSAIGLIIATIGFFVVPVLLVMTINSLIKGNKIFLIDKVFLLFGALSIAGFFILKYGFSSFFSWIMD